ncbi:MAG TPA: 3-phosphoshikimate 1-carboxyvinyltransferase [Bacteroidia bacterium]|nr:3-phosphoshikimate 1-carboxyvinyltransferase [Bacteroidia bacterium]
MEEISIRLKGRTLEGVPALPASKSIANRLLVINALSGNKIKINNLSNANDTVVLKEILNSKLEIRDPEQQTIVDCRDAGTVMRFLIGYFSIMPGKWLLKGTERMHQRPVKILVNKLKELGADIKYLEKDGFPPLLISGKSLKGGKLTIDASISSQYISALMMIGPYLEGGLELELTGKISSLPYIIMTAGIMEQCGVKVEINGNNIFIEEDEYSETEFTVESDWSGASYWYAFAALAENAEITLSNLYQQSLQGDSILAEWMTAFGVETRFTAEGVELTKTGNAINYFEQNFTNCPDLAPTFIVLCAALSIPAKFYGLESLAIKESDRTAAIAAELGELNIDFINREAYWELIPNPDFWKINVPPAFKTYNDHRLAMAFAMFGSVFSEVTIKNPSVVKKSYPWFWKDIELTIK